MVLHGESFPDGYKHQSYSQDGYYSSGHGYSHGPSRHMGPTPAFGSHMMPSGGYGLQHYQPGWQTTTTELYSQGPNGYMSSSYYGGSGFSHGTPTGGYPTSFHGPRHGPDGIKVHSNKHEYSSYGHGQPSMFHNHMQGGHQSAEWKLKAIEDDE